MRKTILLALLALISFSINAANEKPWDNGKLRVSDNHRFLQFENGEPFFWLGETGWLLPQRLDRGKANYYLGRCREAGYNMVQVQVLNGVPSFNTYGQMSNIDGWNFDNINQKGVYGYWDHMDYIIRAAENNGIYIGMVCIWGGLVKGGLIDKEGAKKYGTFLANRYKDRPNIIWMMGGDIPGDINTEIWDTLAETIRSIDKNHLMTYHPRGRYTSAKWFNDRDWLDFNMFQSGHRRYGQRMGNKDYPIPDNTEEDVWMYVDSAWSYKPIKPVLDDEPSYEAIPKGLHDPNEGLWQAEDVRRYAYWSVFAGSCGHSYGHNSIMQMHEPGNGTSYGTVAQMKPWYEALNDPGFNQMKYLKHLMLAFPYLERVPDQSIISGENGTKYERLIATRGNDYLMVYNYTAREMKIDMRKISGKTKSVYWLSAATGELIYIGEFENKEQTFKPMPARKGVNDGVLIAFDSKKDYLKPDMQYIPDKKAWKSTRNLNE